MKKLPLLPVIVLAITVVIGISCKKDKDKSSSCATDVTSISGAYKITAYTYKQTPSSPEQDYYNIIFSDPCERDDVLTLNSNGNFTFTDAGVVCSPSGDYSSTWSLSGNTITIDGDPATVESFDCKTLTVSSTDAFTTGDKIKITLTKQ